MAVALPSPALGRRSAPREGGLGAEAHGAKAAWPADARPAPAGPRDEQRVSERLRALRQEADALAARGKTLLGDLRRLEVERDLKREQQRVAGAELARITRELAETTAHLASLEEARARQIPGLAARLRALYKLGAGGYTHLLLSVEDPRQIGRASRTVAALVRMDRERVRAHERTLAALDAARDELRDRQARAARLDEKARAAAAAAARAVQMRAALIAQIDARRDLNARLLGELQQARQRLQDTVDGLEGATAGAGRLLPLRPFRGALEWPLGGTIISRFGRSGRPGATRGIEIAVPAGTPVRAVHGGTVAHAAPFTGFGRLVILDHGDRAYSLYGYLDTLAVSKGDQVAPGAVVGAAGTAPAGGPALYFELRIDGRAVDPLQWLKPRP